MSTHHSSDGPADLPAMPADPHGSPAIDRRLLLGAASLAGVAALTSLTSRASAGPLTPPAGPIASSGKPLAELEPRIAVNATNTPGDGTYLHVLSAPGSYYLTGDINIPAGFSGINMFSRTTLDLNGFTISGTGGTTTGIQANAECTIRNGSIRNLANGISTGTFNTIEDVSVIGAISRGIRGGSRSEVRRCKVNGFLGGSGIGIEIRDSEGVVEDCNVAVGFSPGISLPGFSTLRRTRVTNCQVGASVGFAAKVESCAFLACSVAGLQTGSRSTVDSCSAVSVASSPGTGFDLGEATQIARSTAGDCVIGFRLANAGGIVDCSADTCSSSGIRCNGSGIIVDNCRLTRNAVALDMIGVGNNYAQRCTALGNTSYIAVSFGGNWYPNVPLGGVNTSTNPLASVVG